MQARSIMGNYGKDYCSKSGQRVVKVVSLNVCKHDLGRYLGDSEHMANAIHSVKLLAKTFGKKSSGTARWK